MKLTAILHRAQRLYLGEVLIIFALILTFNNFIGNPQKTINSDGFGYYDYLVSAFIEHDLVRKDIDPEKEPEKFQRTRDFANGKVAFGIYLPYGERNVNKYSCGVAVLVSPFFLATLWSMDEEKITGFEKPFQEAMKYAAIFYLFLGLIFFRKLCELYDLKSWAVFMSQVLMVFGTGVMHYSNFDAAWSHVYSMTTVSALLLVSKSWIIGQRKWFLVLMAALLGLVFLLRQVNLIVILALPFLAGTWDVCSRSVRRLATEWRYTLVALTAGALVVSIQLVFWYLQTGDFILYSYRDEGFNFLNPRWIDLLFSYQKGLFVYYPVLVFSLIALGWLLIKKRVFEGVVWFVWFAFTVYVFSSWWSWEYGACFGQRPFIDFLALFFLIIAMMLSGLATWIAITMLSVMSFSIPLGVVQTYQYQRFILHWTTMTKEKYWKVFLKTDIRYRYWIWGRNPNYDNLNQGKELELGDRFIESPEAKLIYSEDLGKLYEGGWFDLMRVSFINDFKFEQQGLVLVRIINQESQEVEFIHGVPLFQFEMEGIGKLHEGSYGFKWDAMPSGVPLRLEIEVVEASSKFTMEDLKIRLYARP